ncbi:MAG: GAF domain-containing sensor histidine kinase [Spirochaetota bacterium]
MKLAPIPPEEAARLARLRSYDILDTLDEKEYDDIVRLVAQICDTPMANISFVDRDRQWFKSVVGLEDRETPRDIAFCGHTILGDELLVVPDAQADERFSDNPLVTAGPRIRFYAGMPLITPDGYRLGALCAIDSVPRSLTNEQRQALEILSHHVVNLLELRAQRRSFEELSDLKTRMMAIMAHDLRSPMAAVASAVSLLKDDELSDDDRVAVMQELGQLLDSTQYLIDNVVTWASGEMTDPAPASIDVVDLRELSEELVESLYDDFAAKGNRLTAHINGAGPIESDRNVLLFVLRNLLINANKFTGGGEIELAAEEKGTEVCLSVRDTGIGMSPAEVEGLFDWRVRSKRNGTSGEKGSGLALLLCKDMAARIGASLHVESTEGVGTVFRLRLPTS